MTMKSMTIGNKNAAWMMGEWATEAWIIKSMEESMSEGEVQKQE